MHSQPTTDCERLKIGTTIANRFLLKAGLGSGATGWVFRAEDLELAKTDIALKVLYPHLLVSEMARNRFFNELLITRQLSHPNIVQTFDFGTTEDGLQFISMEFVDGVSLQQCLDRSELEAMSLTSVLEKILEIASGMELAHKKNVVHRDLKPDNILLTKDGQVKILDFGIAELLHSESDESGKQNFSGTPYYMPPEQFHGHFLDTRSDIYSFGIMSYQLLFGRLPFTGRSFFELAQAHLTQVAPRLERSGENVPEWVWNLLDSCLEKEPRKRFSSFTQVKAIIRDRLGLASSNDELDYQPVVIDLESEDEALRARDLVIRRRNLFARNVFLAISATFFISYLFTKTVGLFVGALLNLLMGSAFIDFRRGRRLYVAVASCVILLIVIRMNAASFKRVSAKLLHFERATSIPLTPIKALIGLRINIVDEKDLFRMGPEHTNEELWAVADSGVDLNARDENGETILMKYAVGQNNKMMVRIMEAGALPNERDSLGRTAVFHAALANAGYALHFLSRHGADFSLTDSRGETVLIAALRSSNESLINILLPYCKDYTSRSADTGDYALHYAVKRQFIDVTEGLLVRKVKVNVQNFNGQTALHYAVLSPATSRLYLPLLEALLEAGADSGIRDNTGKTPLDYASEYQRNAAVELLKRARKTGGK